MPLYSAIPDAAQGSGPTKRALDCDPPLETIWRTCSKLPAATAV